MPTINTFDLELVQKALDIINPGRVSGRQIEYMVQSNWPFGNIATGGWVAYAEAPERNDNVRIALTPYSVMKYLEYQASLVSHDKPYLS